MVRTVLRYFFFVCRLLALPAVFLVKYLNIEDVIIKLLVMTALILLFTSSLFITNPFQAREERNPETD